MVVEVELDILATRLCGGRNSRVRFVRSAGAREDDLAIGGGDAGHARQGQRLALALLSGEFGARLRVVRGRNVGEGADAGVETALEIGVLEGGLLQG